LASDFFIIVIIILQSEMSGFVHFSWSSSESRFQMLCQDLKSRK